MAVKASTFSEIQPQRTYVGPEETTWRLRAFQIVALCGILLGTGLLLSSFYSAIPLLTGICGVVTATLSAYGFRYLSMIDSNKELITNVEREDRRKVKFLLFFGANPNIRPVYSPLAIASSRGNSAIVQNLLSAGANPNILSTHNRTPLYYAIGDKQDKTAEILLKNGADPMIKTTELEPDETALDVALRWQWLHQQGADGRDMHDRRTREERVAATNRIVKMLRAINAK